MHPGRERKRKCGYGRKREITRKKCDSRQDSKIEREKRERQKTRKRRKRGRKKKLKSHFCKGNNRRFAC